MSRATREVIVERDDIATSRNRWDRDRFDAYRDGSSRERDIDIHIRDQRSPRRGAGSFAEDLRERDRFYERERYGYGPDRRYWEEPIASEVARGALMPYRGSKVVEYDDYEVVRGGGGGGHLRPERPRFLRRQSSLDTFDRRPVRYEGRDEWIPPAYGPVGYPARGGRRYGDFYEDARVRERDLSPGWEEEYRDVRVRRRGGSKRRRGESIRSRSSSSSSSSESIKSVKKATKVHIGRRGKTRMPKRLVHKQAIIDMGLAYDEEENFIIVRRALEKEHIDDILRRSEGYRDSKITYKFEEIKSDGFGKVDDAEAGAAAEFVRSIDLGHGHGHGHEELVEETKTEVLEEGKGSVVGVGRRSDRSIRDEIRALELEREALRLERRSDRKLLAAEGYRDDYDVELVERRGLFGLGREEVVRVEKDRRGKMALVAKRV